MSLYIYICVDFDYCTRSAVGKLCSVTWRKWLPWRKKLKMSLKLKMKLKMLFKVSKRTSRDLG